VNRPRVDPQTAWNIHALLHKCATEGRDPIRALDELGHLNFPALEAHIRYDALTAAALLIDVESIDAIHKGLADPAGQPLRVPMTPYETKRMIVTRLLQLAELQVQPTQKENPTQ
jgi:hypothetical protein